MEDAFPIDAPVGVRAEVVALGLREVGGQAFAAVGIEVRQGCRGCQHGNAQPDPGLQCFSPDCLMIQDNVTEGVIKQQIGQLGVSLKCTSNMVLAHNSKLSLQLR